MKRPSYRAAIQWLADNDDCDWLESPEPTEREVSVSVSAALVADMFGKTDAEITADLRRVIARDKREVPPCAVSMGCLCAFHARGCAVSIPCNACE